VGQGLVIQRSHGSWVNAHDQIVSSKCRRRKPPQTSFSCYSDTQCIPYPDCCFTGCSIKNWIILKVYDCVYMMTQKGDPHVKLFSTLNRVRLFDVNFVTVNILCTSAVNFTILKWQFNVRVLVFSEFIEAMKLVSE